VLYLCWEICLIAVWYFNVSVSNYLLIFLISYLFIIFALLVIGLVSSNVFKSVAQATPFIVLTFFSTVFLSNVFTPIERIPHIMYPVVYANPMYHMNQLLVCVWNGRLNDPSLLLSITYLIMIIVCCVLLIYRNEVKKDK